MLTTRRRTILALLPLVFIPTVARADDTAACNAAYEQADLLVHSSAGDKLLDAREKMRACASPTCKDWMVKDCSRWLSDLEPRIPTVVFSAKESDGSDLTQVNVSVDGKVLAPQLDGHAIEMDPGARVFVFTAVGGRGGGGRARPRVEIRATVEEGEKAQRVAATFAKPGSADGSVTSPDVTSSGAHPPLRTVGFVVGGVGIASIAVGSVLGLMAISKNSDSNANGHCDASGCDATGTSLRNTALSDATVSTITFVAGGVLAAAGVVLVLTAPHAKAPTTGRLELRPAASPHGAGLDLGGSW
jgi:hypothetical protein